MAFRTNRNLTTPNRYENAKFGTSNVRFPDPTEQFNMMTYAKMGEYVSAEPFRPFRIKMASGQEFDIRHPEMIMVGRSSAKIYKSSETDPNGPPFWQEISLMLTESLEPIEPKSSERIN